MKKPKNFSEGAFKTLKMAKPEYISRMAVLDYAGAIARDNGRNVNAEDVEFAIAEARTETLFDNFFEEI